MAKYKIAGGSLNQIPLDWKNNLKNIKDCIVQARGENIDIICLPELAITGYGCEDLFLSEWLPEKAASFVDEIASVCENIFVSVGLPIRFEGKLYNCSCVIQNQKILGFTAKQHLANDGVHYETRWFTPWQPSRIENITIDGINYPIGDIIYDVEDMKIGFEICEDAWRGDERPACRLVERGVNLILNPSASHFAMGKSKTREDLVVTSSKSFNCTYAYANLLGNEAGRMIFDGEILIAQNGKLIQRNTKLSFKNINLVSAEIDFENSNNTTADLNDDFHDKNTEFIQAEALALFDYMRKSRSNGFILSLSGGADSSTCAILVSEMVRRGIAELGFNLFVKKLNLNLKGSQLSIKDKEKLVVNKILTCAYQGTKNSSKETLASANILAEEIGATFYEWKIDEEVTSYTHKIEKATGLTLNWEEHDITLQNIQARARSPIIWMLANLKNCLLITTSNRSEGDVGYATMDGDTSGSIAPISAVDKQFIINWLQWAEKELGYESLSNVNNLSPSAELRPLAQHQTDEDDLMPYHIIIEIEKLAIRDHRSPQEVFDDLSKRDLESDDLLKAHITKFYRLWARNQWKRERIAPAFHLDDFNVDPRTWCRFPILSGSFTEELELLNGVCL